MGAAACGGGARCVAFWENAYCESLGGQLRDELFNGRNFVQPVRGKDRDRAVETSPQRETAAVVAGIPAVGASDAGHNPPPSNQHPRRCNLSLGIVQKLRQVISTSCVPVVAAIPRRRRDKSNARSCCRAFFFLPENTTPTNQLAHYSDSAPTPLVLVPQDSWHTRGTCLSETSLRRRHKHISTSPHTSCVRLLERQQSSSQSEQSNFPAGAHWVGRLVGRMPSPAQKPYLYVLNE